MMVTLRRSRYLLLIGFGVLSACGLMEAGYFQSQVDQVTQDAVARRYGEPHKVAKLPEGRTVWTYFDRGSSSVGYGGYASRGPCKAYLLTFDQDGVLRDWQQQDCTSRKTTTESPATHN
jgi:hypothetical protein